MKLVFDSFPTPLGEMTAAFSGDALCHLDFGDCAERMERLLFRRFGVYGTATEKNPAGIRDRVGGYFGGNPDAFDGLKLETGGTAFQRSVWRALIKIPRGQTVSYAELARNIGRPGAWRAVGAANGRNPLAIVIPCHRVIAADGGLAGYAGGIERKGKLLALELGL